MDAVAADPSPPVVAGGECLSCGHRFAPAQAYGCERCGAYGDRLVARAWAARGRVKSAAVVHMHRTPPPEPPFTVLEVALDDGPVIRVLADAAGPTPAAGDAVEGAPLAPDGLPRFRRPAAASTEVAA